MTPEQFTYWLQGFMEILDPSMIHEKETQIIKDHLKLVFKKETPTYTLSSLNLGVKDLNPKDYNTDWLYKPGDTIC